MYPTHYARYMLLQNLQLHRGCQEYVVVAPIIGVSAEVSHCQVVGTGQLIICTRQPGPAAA